jgi:lycopene cyclase domain-containing protein
MQFSSFTYLAIDLLIITGPLLYSGDKRLRYYRYYPAVGLSILIVGAIYITWDVVVTAWGEWSFNRRYVTGIHVLNLPLEEVLFFITVPYSCLFVYEAVLYYAKSGSVGIRRMTFFFLVGALIGTGLMFFHQGYTMKALLSCGLFLACAMATNRDLIENRRYWMWLAICYVPFLLVNLVLTALPVVQYNQDAIWGGRFVTIPFEDFFYNFSMLSFYLLFYVLFKERLRLGDTIQQGV